LKTLTKVLAEGKDGTARAVLRKTECKAMNQTCPEPVERNRNSIQGSSLRASPGADPHAGGVGGREANSRLPD